jgi:NAD(P)-dependent dehydrogenase (short-subunit alcohol dehydrogenase family)
MRYQDKIALITAAANGIGRATCEIITREGGIVIAVDNHQERLDTAVEAMTKAGGRVHGRLCDALDQAQVDAIVADVTKEFGRIDVLVNAVGGSTIIPRPNAKVDELSLDEWQRLISFNLDGTFLFLHAVVPVMKSSVAYCAAKGGIIALTRKLSIELGEFNINVNAIAPSLTLTERIRPHWNQRSPEARSAEIERTPLKRVAEAADQAKVICFLASSDADFVTGLTIDVTGGL